MGRLSWPFDHEVEEVVVLGPPRSGTSATAGVLDALGVYMGNLRGATPENPKGLFEDSDILELARRICIEVDPALDDIDGAVGFFAPSREEVQQHDERFEEEIRTLLQERRRTAEGGAWGWKVIHSAVVMDLFLPHLQNPGLVLVHRNPAKTARSLVNYTKGREGFDFAEALGIGTFYQDTIAGLVQDHPDVPICNVIFEDLVREPLESARRLAKFLDLDMTPQREAAVRDVIIPRDRIQSEKRKQGLKQILGKLLP